MKKKACIALLIFLLIAALMSAQGGPIWPLLVLRNHDPEALMPAILKLTDGSVEINLIKGPGQAGFHLARWRPSISPYKGGGTWQDSPLADGRRLADKKFENGIESFELKLIGASQDEAIYESQELRRLLEKASDYWTTSWQDEPVWIEAAATCESNARYAIIHLAQIPEDENPYAQPFLQADGSAVMDALTLVVERGPWLSCRPGTGTPTEASALEDYDGRNLGNVDSAGVRQPTTADAVYVANKRNVSNLTDVWWWDSVGAAWCPVNLMDVALPFALFQNPPAAGDVVLFGTDNTIADSGPFCSLVFDLLTAQDDLTIEWRYSRTGADVTGAPWPGLAVQDNTNNAGAMAGQPLDTAGVGSVHWHQPADWAPFNPTVGGGAALGVTGLWVAAVITGVGVAPAAPWQQNRDIYSVVWPYAEVQAAVVGGDIQALLRAELENRSDRDGRGGAAPNLWDNRVIVGLRSYDRGAGFTSHINFANEQNPAGITVNLGGSSAWAADVTTPTGVRLTETVNAAATTWTYAFDINIVPPLLPHLYGVFHAFIRAYQTAGAAGDVDVRLRYHLYGSPGVYSAAASFPSTDDWVVLDLGRVQFPPSSVMRTDESGWHLRVDILVRNHSGANRIVYFYDLVLIPADEWAFDTLDLANSSASLLGRVGNVPRFLEADSLAYPKYEIRSVIKGADANEYVIAVWQSITPGPAVLQANARQRLWFLCARTAAAGAGPIWISEPWQGHSVQLERAQRYLSMRGAR